MTPQAIDLFAINVARGRDHRLPTYASARSLLGLTIPTTFDEVTGGRDCITEVGAAPPVVAPRLRLSALSVVLLVSSGHLLVSSFHVL